MGKLITGSLNLTDIYKKSKEGHSAFNVAKDGRVFVNLKIWENDEPDKFGNHFSVQLAEEKDAPESEKKVYVGNLKRFSSSGRIAASTVKAGNSADDDLPF